MKSVSLNMRIASRMSATLLFGLGIHAQSLVRADGAEPKQSANEVKESALGTIDGFVTFQGEIPKTSIPDDAGAQRDLLRVDATSRGLANVVVWLSAEDSRLTNRTSEMPLGLALMDQRDHEFVPRVLAVLAGQPVKFSNSDPANHNVRTSSSQATNEFNVFTGVDGSYTHRFTADPQQRPIRLGCDIHPWMRGWIYVLEHPYFAVTDERGRFRISQIPPGKYRMQIVQPDLNHREQREVLVRPGAVCRVESIIRGQESKVP